MLSDSFLKHPDLPISLLVLCFILFTGYLLSRELNTNCVSCFALTQFNFKIISHQAPIYLSELHLYTPSTVPGSSALLQTSECSEYHPSALSPVVSTLFFSFFLFTRLHLLQPTPVWVFLSTMLPLTVVPNLPWKPFSVQKPLLQPQRLALELRYKWLYVYVCVCVRERERVHVIIVNQ